MSLLIALLLASTPPPAEVTNQAREHFKAAQLHYSLGEFEDAVKEFREAYRLRQEPAILFNIGQGYRQLHKYEEAYFHYRQYLSQKPDAPNRAEVESLIEQMSYQVEQEKEQRTRIARDPKAAHNTEAVLAAAQPETVPPVAAAPSAMPKLHVAGHAALGAGALAGGAAFILHGSAQSAAEEFNRKYAAGQLSSGDARLKSSAESNGRLATVALIGGAALLVTGALLRFAF